MADDERRMAEVAGAKALALGLDLEATARLEAERARSETPAMARARLRAERGEAKATAAQAAARARLVALEDAVEAELDLRAGGPGSPPLTPEGEAKLAAVLAAHPAWFNAPGLSEADREARAKPERVKLLPLTRLAVAMNQVGALAELADGLAAAPRKLLAAAVARRASDVCEGPSPPNKRGRGGRWLRQGEAFLRSRDDLDVGAYANGESGDPRSTEKGCIIAIRTVDSLTRYYDVATGAGAAIPAAIAAYDAAQAEVTRIADEREAAEVAEEPVPPAPERGS
jgi:hypothetical protein